MGAKMDRKGAIGATRRFGQPVLRLSFSLAFILVWVLPRLTFAGEPTATVLVYNYARVPPAIVTVAEHEAGRILGAAGVRIIWVECPIRSTTTSAEGSCPQTLETSDLMLRVLPLPDRHGLKAEVFGSAISSDLASVYYDGAVRLAVELESVEFDARIILGCVVAHELGHLLLGSNSHSGVGIMRSPWGRKQVQEALMGTLVFTAKQAKIMQAEVRARTRPKNARFRVSPPGSSSAVMQPSERVLTSVVQRSWFCWMDHVLASACFAATSPSGAREKLETD